jgi:four helix bundle protein
VKIERFEDIKAWQEARILVKMVYGATSNGSFNKDYRLRDQIQASAVSSMSNIAEGFDSQSDAEFIRFLSYARRSASETQSHLYVAVDCDYLTQEKFDEVYQKAVLVKNIIGGFIRYLKKKTSDLGLRTSDLGLTRGD